MTTNATREKPAESASPEKNVGISQSVMPATLKYPGRLDA
jgi:hypothetical protein